MPFALRLTLSAQEEYDGIRDPRKRRKVDRCLGRLEQDPRHPGLHSHPYEEFDKVFGEKVWESYVENQTPSAWRVWWAYGPSQAELTVLMIGPHP
jgi:hypothetical protein